MKSKVQPVTLENIGKLIDQKLGPVNHELHSLNTKVVGIYGELDDIKQQITQVDSEIAVHREETKKGFDEVYDGIRQVMGDLDESNDQKVDKLRKEVEAKFASQ